MNSRYPLIVLLAWLAAGGGNLARADDWPMWRRDPHRSAASVENLPADLTLRWTRAYSPRVQVWDDPLNHDLMPYDRVFEPIVLGGRMFIGFNDRDKLVALDIESGRELWTVYADGPVRLAPVAWQDKVYFASDDGYLYCVSAEDGSLRWKFRGAPSQRKALGNRRVISAWPARGGPVIRDGTIYFAASIWPFMGTFIHALDANTGKTIWVNDGTGAQYIRQPHSAPAFAGVAPQGALVATEKHLIVPGGRSVPAVFDRRTGEFLHFHINDGGKGTGGSFVAATDTEFFVHTRERGVRAFDLATGKKGDFTTNEPVLDGGMLYTVNDRPEALAKLRRAEEKLAPAEYAVRRAKSRLRIAEEAGDPAGITKAQATVATAEQDFAKAQAAVEQERQASTTRHSGPVLQAIGPDRKVQWEAAIEDGGEVIRAGSRFYLGAANRVLAVAPPADGGEPKVVWSHPVEGKVMRLLAAQGHLFAVTLDGRILAFGRADQAAATLRETPAPISPAPVARQRARTLLAQSGAEGYALYFGIGDAKLLDALLAESQLHVTVVDPDGTKVEALRRRYDAAGLYGTRVAVHVGDPKSFLAPAYIANLVVVGDAAAARLGEAGQLQAIYESVRPYGGCLSLEDDAAAPRDRARWVEAAALPQARVRPEGSGTLVVREGALPGAADWNHQYGNVANTVKSDDRIVKLPLGVLWFGGNTHDDVLPRHGHGPSEQVVGGRLIIQGMDCLSARDVYTGRVLWKTTIPGLDTYGIYWDDTYLEDSPLTTIYSQVHIPGANARGANYVATEEAIYVVTGSECQVLDSRTGRITRTIRMPARDGGGKAPEWGYLGVYKDVLLGGAGFARYSKKLAGAAAGNLPPPADFAASEGLVAFDRHTGKVLWRTEARHSFWHNGIVAGNGRVYCLDRLPKSAEGKLKRRGQQPPSDYRIVALDLRSGQPIWETTSAIFGSWLGYSEIHDRLLQAGASASDRLADEVSKGMITYRGADGAVMWENLELAYNGPCILHGDLIITSTNSYKNSSGAFSLLDGKPHLIPNPLTGKMEPWQVHRTYGCNYIVASENLLTFRAGAAGFYDLENHAGTGSLGGFKSGCSPNLIVANGVLNAPDYTRTCSCAYQNQTSLAFVHMPELEVWTYSLLGAEIKESEPVARVGLNLGAPGDRLSETGTLWLEYPFVGGIAPNLQVKLSPARPEFFLRHASQMSGDGPAWVVASGVRNLESILISPRLDQAIPVAPPRRSRDDDEDNEPSQKARTAKAAAPTAAPSPKPAEGKPQKPALPAGEQLYTVRLYFAEPDDLQAGERVFDIALQDQPLLSGFDIVREAGGVRRGVVREFKHIRITEQLAVRLKPAAASKHPPVLSGVELVVEPPARVAHAGPPPAR